MKVVKIKYKGQWRKVIGMSTNELGQVCYKVQCDDKRYFNKIWVYDPKIEDKEERDISRYPSKVRRYKDLTDLDKESIAKRFHSGVYTLKEICDMFVITRLTVKKIVGVI